MYQPIETVGKAAKPKGAIAMDEKKTDELTENELDQVSGGTGGNGSQGNLIHYYCDDCEVSVATVEASA